MVHLTYIWMVLFPFLFHVTFSTVTEESSYLNKHEKEVEFKRTIEHLTRLASRHAKPIDRADLIANGYAKSFEHIKFPIHEKPLLDNRVFDCKIRKLAFDFAKKIATRGLKDIFRGLELHSLCNITFESTIIKRRKKLNIVYPGNHENKLEIFVDQAIGKFENDGSFTNPLSDIQSGINLCIAKRLSSEMMCNVFIRSGVYQIKEPLTIQNDNIMLLAYQSEHVYISSDVDVKPTWKLYKRTLEVYKGLNPIFEGVKPGQTTESVIFLGVMGNATLCEQTCNSQHKCTAFVFFDKSTAQYANHCYMRVDGRWNTLLTSGVVSGKKVLIYSADLSNYDLHEVNSVFINKHRAIRARYPNADPETMGLHTVPTGYVRNAVKWLPPRNVPAAEEVHISTPKRPLSLFPTFDLGFGGPVYQFDPPQSYWGLKNPTGGAASTYKVPSGLQYSKDLEINLRSWKNPSTGVLHTYQHYHWGNWMFKLDGRNEKLKTLQWTYGGFQESRGAHDGKEWYVENIFEELDVANEWFYDENKKIIYYSPNTTEDDLPTKLSIPQLPSLLQIVGTRSRPVRNPVVAGLSFHHTTKTFLKSYVVPSGGDWTVHKTAMAYLEGTENAVIDKCTFNSPEGNGLMVYKYNKDTQITNNLFYRLGDNGIVLIGDTHMIDGSQGVHPRGVKVMHNTIFDNGIWGKQTYPFVQTLSCESYLEGNVFFNGPRAGVNFNDGFGGGNIINNNLLFNFVRETDDHGPINTWDRVPYLTTLFDGKQVSLKVKENRIHYNFIINNYRSVWPIDHDDGTCFWNDTHNYLVYGGFKNFMGHDKYSVNNIYVYPDREGGRSAPFCLDTRSQGLGTSGYGDVYQNNTCIIGRINIYRLGNCQVSHLRELIPLLKENHYFTPQGRLFAQCGRQTWNLEQFRTHGMEIGTVVKDLIADDEVIKWGKDLFKI